MEPHFQKMDNTNVKTVDSIDELSHGSRFFITTNKRKGYEKSAVTEGAKLYQDASD